MSPMGLQRVPYPKFGGLNLVDAPYDLGPHESPALQNVRRLDPTDDETIWQRRGLLNLTAAGATTPSSEIRGGVWLPATTAGTGAVLLTHTGDSQILTQTVTGTPQLSDFTSILAAGGGAGEWHPVVTIQTAVPTAWFMPSVAGGGPKKYTAAGGLVAWGATPPTNCMDMVYWRGRMCLIQAANPHRIFYSDIGNPESPATADWGNNFIDIFDQEGSRNVGLLVHNNNLYLFKERSVWMIFDPNTFANRLLTKNGSPSPTYKAKCSNPGNRRMYWLSQDAHIHSSNGETDDVIETWKVKPRIDNTNPLSVIFLAVEPESKSVMVGHMGIASDGTNIRFNRLFEICIAGKPGEHPIYTHDFSASSCCLFEVPLAASVVQTRRPRLLMPDVAGSRRNIYDLFNQVGSDNGTAITAFYTSAWAPFISEEPAERLRRVNFLYRGVPIFDISSTMTPAAAPPVFTLSPTEFAGASDVDRTFVTLNGPNKKGRYHMFQIRNNVLGKDFAVSALEFVLRGGKEKK